MKVYITRGAPFGALRLQKKDTTSNELRSGPPPPPVQSLESVQQFSRNPRARRVIIAVVLGRGW